MFCVDRSGGHGKAAVRCRTDGRLTGSSVLHLDAAVRRRGFRYAVEIDKVMIPETLNGS